MKRKGKYRSMLLALLLSLAMVVTYMPAWMITYAEDEISNQTEIELNEENAAGDSAADVTGETGSAAGEITNDSGDTEETGDPSDEQTDEQTDGAKGPTGLEEEGVEGDSLLTEEGKDLDDLDNERPNMLMLHNSWTPKWYKQLNMDAVRTNKCTLSNIINALI